MRPKDKDEEDLAKRLRKLDKRLGEGIAYTMVQVQAELEMLREKEVENGQRERLRTSAMRFQRDRDTVRQA